MPMLRTFPFPSRLNYRALKTHGLLSALTGIEPVSTQIVQRTKMSPGRRTVVLWTSTRKGMGANRPGPHAPGRLAKLPFPD